MGRGYVVEEAVESYLSNLRAAGAGCVTGLLIGQSSSQRDFVVLAVRTPHKEGEGPTDTAGSSLDNLDVEWVTEHARQVSRMLPGGVCVLGVFLVTPPELAKEAQNTLRRLVFAVDRLLSRARLWTESEDDVTEKVTLHICSKTRKAVCRSFDVRDPKSSAKPADWRYQSGVCGAWPVLTCSVGLDLLVPVATTHLSPDHLDRSMKEGLRRWARRIEGGVCLLNGRRLSDDAELGGAQKKNSRAVQQTFRARLLLPSADLQADSRSTASVCSGSLSLTGVVHCRAYLHSNKPRAKHAAEVIKRDIITTVTSRVEMLLEDLLMNEGDDRGRVCGQLLLPQRVFAPLPPPSGSVCVCDYMFPDEGVCEVRERLREMLDLDIPEDHLHASQEPRTPAGWAAPPTVCPDAPAVQPVDTAPPTSAEAPPTGLLEGWTNVQYYTGVAMAAAVALLATATSLLYLSD